MPVQTVITYLRSVTQFSNRVFKMNFTIALNFLFTRDLFVSYFILQIRDKKL